MGAATTTSAVSVVAPLLALCSCEWFVLLSCVLLSCACACDKFSSYRRTHARSRCVVLFLSCVCVCDLLLFV